MVVLHKRQLGTVTIATTMPQSNWVKKATLLWRTWSIVFMSYCW